jgi:hypothetical protein
MKALINRVLVRLSIRPFKTVKLPTGLIVKHYVNGKLIADQRDTRYGK